MELSKKQLKRYKEITEKKIMPSKWSNEDIKLMEIIGYTGIKGKLNLTI